MFWSKRFKRKCPDGTIHEVYKNVDDAFSLYIGSRDLSIKGNIKLSENIGANVDAKHSECVYRMFNEIEAFYQSSIISFRAIYTVYQSEPCSNAIFYRDGVKKIVDDLSNLSALKTCIQGFVKLSSINNCSGESVLDTYKHITDTYGKYIPKETAFAKMSEMVSCTKEWQESSKNDQ